MRWPLVRNNITRGDLDALIAFLQQDDPRLTQGEQVAAFEREFADWLGVKYAVMVNSGSSANLITMAALRHLRGPGEVIVPTLTWSSDIMSVMHAGLKPVFVDIDPQTLGMDWGQVYERITKDTRAVFLTHVLGFNALEPRVVERLYKRRVNLIEDCCEAIGATFEGRRVGTFDLASNFSFYYAHHMTTVEGGMVCTDDDEFYQTCRLLRSHGLSRERTVSKPMTGWMHRAPLLQPLTHSEFTFELPAYNVRSTEINAVLGRRQLKQMAVNIGLRNDNCRAFLDGLDAQKYRTDYAVEGMSNYALPLILAKPDGDLMRRVLAVLEVEGIEYRRGTAGGGNQLRQPYLGRGDHADYPTTEHIHDFGLYVGNFPDLPQADVAALAKRVNAL